MNSAEAPPETSFVYDCRPGYDFCVTPRNLRLHGSLSFNFARENTLTPVFQLSKFSRCPNILTTPLQAYENVTTLEDMGDYLPWGQKTIDKLFWRGSTTGDSYTKSKKGLSWKDSHRPRMHLMCQTTVGSSDVWVQRKRWTKETWSNEVLNSRYMDVGLAGKVHQVSTISAGLRSRQCRELDGTCDEMREEVIMKDPVPPKQASQYKCEFLVWA